MNKFQHICQKVVQLSNRPDVIEEIKQCVRQATLAMHHIDFFHRDLVSGLIRSTRNSRQELSIQMSEFPRVRSIKAIVPTNSQQQFGMAATSCYKPLTPNPSLEVCRCTTNWWRTNGGTLTISSSYPTAEYEMYFYQNPSVFPDESYSSWMADLYEEVLIDWTLMLLFEVLRDSAASDRYRARVGSRDRGPSGHIAMILGEQLEQSIRSY